MAAPDYTDLFRWVYDWQTMIAGIVAVVGATGGGVLAYCAGVKQATATRHAADRQIRALQEQNADLKRAEQRRLARESSTVAGMLYAAMGLVARDIGTALAAIPKAISASFRDRLPPDDPPLDAQIANYIRHMVRKYGFDYLRDRVGTFNREDIAVAFMLLEAEIDLPLAEQGAIQVSQLRERLEHLFKTVTHLRMLATKELERANTILSGGSLPTQ
jgi:hypothetical protein